MTVATLQHEGLDLLVEHGAQAESDLRSCLVCRHYQLKDHGFTVRCTKRAKTFIEVGSWDVAQYGKCLVRARRCTDFEDMREV